MSGSVAQKGQNAARQGRSLRSKLLAAFLALSLLPLVAAAAIAFVVGYNTLHQGTARALEQTVEMQAQALDTWIAERRQDMETVAGTARVRSMEPKQVADAVSQYHQMWGVYETMFVAGPDGMTIYNTDQITVSVADRAYFKQAMQGQLVVSDPVISKGTGNVIVVIAAPIRDKDKIVGVAVGTMATGTLVKGLQTAQLGATGEAYLVNREGYFITPSRFTDDLKRAGAIKERAELELKVDTVAARAALSGESGVGEYTTYRGARVLGAYRPISGLGWALIAEQDVDEAFAAVNALRNWIAVVVVVSAAIVVVVALWIARGIVRPVQAVTEAANKLALGDVDQQVAVAGDDEVGVMAAAFRQMIAYLREVSAAATRLAGGDLTVEIAPRSARDQVGQALQQMIAGLRALVGQVQANAEQVADAGEQIDAASAQSAQVTQQVAMTIQQVAQGTATQAQAMAQAAAQVQEIARDIDRIAAGSQEQMAAVRQAAAVTERIIAAIHEMARGAQASAHSSAQTVEAARLGVQTVAETVQGMQTVKSKVGVSAARVQEMGERSSQIGAIVETIDEIAGQTNLLALNAAIEAARAGEQGRGFAVVADEVRKLAERSAAATREIAELIKGIQQTVAEAVQAMEEGAQEVERGAARAGDAGQALNTILVAVEGAQQTAAAAAKSAQEIGALSDELKRAINGVAVVAEQNSEATRALAAGGEQISAAIESAASVSEENSAAAEEVSAAAEELSAQVEEMAASAQSLAEVARRMREGAARFKLAQEAEEARTHRQPTVEEARPRQQPAARALPDRPLPVTTVIGRG
jgi:methyl-accepting chemotaxis protein